MRASGGRRTALLAALVGLGAVGLADASAQESVPVPVRGRTFDVRLADGERLSGELIEVDERALLLWGSGGFRRLELTEVVRAEYERHGFGSKQALTWVGVGGLLTAAGLSIACTQVEDTSCGAVFAGVTLSWAIIGGLLAGSLASGRMQVVDPTQERLRPLARFPQGAPQRFLERASGESRSPR
jgi:hypothetical protein